MLNLHGIVFGVRVGFQDRYGKEDRGDIDIVVPGRVATIIGVIGNQIQGRRPADFAEGVVCALRWRRAALAVCSLL